MTPEEEQELRDQLDEVTDEEIVEQRRRLEEGEVQPKAVIVDAAPILPDVIEIEPGQSVEVPLEFDPAELLRTGGEGDRIMLVIRRRSLTENLFSVLIELGQAGEFPDPVPDVGNRLAERDANGRSGEKSVVLTELFFFDHVDGEQHRPGMVMEASSPIGHYSLSVSDRLELADEIGVTKPAVRFTVLTTHPDHPPGVAFSVGEVALALVRYEYDR